MQTTYKLNADELDDDFLLALKTLFKHKQIEIVVNELETEDETAYLLHNPVNRQRLIEALENVEQHRDLVMIDVDSLQ